MKYFTASLLLFLLASCVRPPVTGVPVNEKEYYRLMFEQATTSAANATTLTQWALGIVIAVVTIILAVQYFFNIRSNKIELDAVREALSNTSQRLTDLVNTTQELNKSKSNEFESEIKQLNLAMRRAEMRIDISSGRPGAYGVPEMMLKRALDIFMDAIEMKIFDTVTANDIILLLKGIKDLDESWYGVVMKIMPYVKGRTYVKESYDVAIASFLQEAIEEKPVYRIVNGKREYLRNPPAPKS